MTIWRRVVCWISKATRAKAYTHAPAHATTTTHTHTETSDTAFTLQQCSDKRASMLCYTYIASLVICLCKLSTRWFKYDRDKL